jgi:NAD(P)-dependent dehydrogenase (short-subunit alcohol dehydrogenase family)
MKQVLVIGGGGGLGRAIVARLLDRQFEVVVAGRSRPADRRVTRSYAIDFSGLDWRSLYTTIETDIKAPIDALVFVAGIGGFGKTALFPLEQARTLFEINFWACTSAAAQIAEFWASSGRAGTFIGVLSLAARRPVPFEAYYSASKAAADRFLQCLDLEYGSRGIRILSALPGVLNTTFRESAQWYGLGPSRGGRTTDVCSAACAIERMLKGTRTARIIGWRERIIDIADRLAPGLYEQAVLRRRAARLDG